MTNRKSGAKRHRPRRRFSVHRIPMDTLRQRIRRSSLSHYPCRTYTGSMLVQHMAGYIDKDVAVNTRDFFDMGVKVAYDFKLYKSVDLQLSAGVQNVFNAYQNDFDQGVERDSGYIYGPAAPRSYFAGIKISY